MTRNRWPEMTATAKQAARYYADADLRYRHVSRTTTVLVAVALAAALFAVAVMCGCATTPPRPCPPCEPVVEVREVPLPVILPWPAPERLPDLVLPEYPARPADEAELATWALAVKRTAQDREAIPMARIEALNEQLDAYRATAVVPPGS